MRDIFGWGMSPALGSNLPAGDIGGGGGGSGETESEEPKESLTTSTSTSSSSSTSSCTVTYTVAPHCTQPCVVSQIKSLGTSSYITSCATATCRTTQMCTSIDTTTTTTFTTKRHERTAACMPKKCPACQQNTPQASSKELEARQSFWDELILQETITEPETWAGGEYEWWEKMRRVAKTYGPGLHIDSKYRMDSSSSWTPFGNAPHGGGAGPVWGGAIVVAFSPEGVYANHLWEIPNFSIPLDEEEYFNVDGGYSEDYYFRQNIEMFPQQGSVAFPFQEQYPALAPMVDASGPLHAKDFQFFRTIVFVSTHPNGEMFYKRDNRRIIDILSNKIKKRITIYGYQPRYDLGKDFDYDFGRATPPPRIRASNPWDGLFSWLYTPKGPTGQRELVVRYEKNIIHREAWCGSGRAIPDAPPSNFDLRPKADGRLATIRPRQEDAACGRFILCGLGSPEALCGDYRKYPPPSLTGQLPKRQLPPSSGPTQAERELSTDIMIDPKDAIGGEIWWWNRMRNTVSERGAGFGGHPDKPEQWSTSTLVTLNQEVDGTVTNRPRFGGSGPIWGCMAIIVASPEAPRLGDALSWPTAFEQWSQIFPRPTVEYFREEFLDFLDNGNIKGTFKQPYENRFPGSNPGLKDMFMENGAFNVKEKEFVWVGIVTRSYKNLNMPRVQYDWQIQQVYEKFIAWGVDSENINVKACPARWDFIVGGSQIQPHWGILSWQYHPEHREGNHAEKKIRVRFEKELLFEKSWCGSGTKIAEPEGEAHVRRRQEDIEACKMVISSKESASTTRVSTALPEPTQACTNDTECGSLSCPENRISVCYHDFCHCVILANPSNTEVLTGTIYATPTTTLDASQTPTFPVSWLLPNVTSTVPSLDISSALSSSMTSASLTSTMVSISSTIALTSNLTATSSGISSILSSMATLTLSAWNPEESARNTCTIKEDCSALKCSDDQYPYCRVQDGTNPGCHCFDKPRKLLDACSTADDCANIDCEARHIPTCRPVVYSPDITPICLCDADIISPGTTCLVDTHCDGLPCDVANQRGFCKSNACQCDFFISEGVGCSTHYDCSPIRCSEAKPHKTCSISSNTCECSASAPAPRRAEGDQCSTDADCTTIGCTDFEVSVCEANVCRCRAWKCGSDKDCDSSDKTCDYDKNLRCVRGKLPKCVHGCQSFWCGKEC
ncbi:uncharacterized protein ColSpa_09717 [Colletotrichum spaethianum]|uniref:Uncharacterized protein n=1 Tax=Colletotrichum spaethianum TaxID=700344 RepID=A0AA37PC35_9PEZI|nr:uncharacterized protein ColSpa_09717 [Colletotrichum spaethianum]GKT49536.1 hypothetical protein ColSpa_09717 [Colletotrichum spaethianum]